MSASELEEQIRTAGWLQAFPATPSPPTTGLMPSKQLVDPFTGAPERTVVPQRSFSEVVRDLRADAAELPRRAPAEISDLALRRLDGKQLVVESVDSEGNARPRILTGYTQAGAAVQDMLARLRRD